MPSRVKNNGEGFHLPSLLVAGFLILVMSGSAFSQEDAESEGPLSDAVVLSEQEDTQGSSQKDSQKGSDVSSKTPTVELNLEEAIRMALVGNRPYLDRVDSIRERFGIGEVSVEQVFLVTPGDGTDTVAFLPPVTTGLDAARTQFQTTISPSVSLSKSKSEGQEVTESESIRVSIGKQFVTGGRLSVSSSMASADFEDRSSSLRLNFSQPLLRNAWPFVVNEGVVAARSNLRKEELALECCDGNSRQGLIFEVISQYWGIQNQTELVDIARLSVQRSEKLFHATSAKQRVELATQLDVSRAEVQLSIQQGALSQARQELGNSKEAFKVLIGLESEEVIGLTDPVMFTSSDDISEERLEEFIQVALGNRPDLEVARIKVEDAIRKRRITQRNLLPDLNSSMSYGVSNVGGLNEQDLSNTGSWTAGLSLSYPLPLTSRRINIEKSGVSLKREKRQVVEIKEEINQQIKTDVRNVVKGREQVEIVKKEIFGAEKKLKIATFRFERGLADNFDIVDAENNLIRARQNLTQTIISYRIALAELQRDMGVLNNES